VKQLLSRDDYDVLDGVDGGDEMLRRASGDRRRERLEREVRVRVLDVWWSRTPARRLPRSSKRAN
jgi:hypothetical protein